ncbi:MAG TPA: sigma-70 family RNA polymerase sigma factor [Puia sp.]|nr:sigma-70 family RNA polymerase sigma factor [Puia sp.]
MNPELLDSEIWISRFKSGDQAAFREAFELYGSNLFFYVKSIVRDKKEASDIVSASFINLWQERKNFSQLKKINDYLYQITREACVNYLKKTDQKPLFRKELSVAEDETHDDVVNRMIYGDILKIVFDRIEYLPEPEKMVFKLTYVEALNPAEIAMRLGISRWDTSHSKNRALEFLRRSLAEKNVLISLVLLEIICYAKMNHII